jgi:prepilin-type N-terminal cleavage/methylation domain-containing protein
LRKVICIRSILSQNPVAQASSAFTLLELLIALTIMSTAMTVVVACFVVTLKGWEKGGKMLDGLRHGDFVMEQLVSAVRSAAFFPNNPSQYGFWLEDGRGGSFPADAVSFVTSGTALMRMDSPLIHGLHRIEIAMEDNPDGERGVAVRAIPHLMDPEEWDGDWWFVSTTVKGFDCRTYNLDKEQWDDDWENTNAVPSLVELTLYMDALEDGEPPLTISRVVEIPVAPVVAGAVQFRQEELEEQDAAEAEAEAAELQRLQDAGLLSPDDFPAERESGGSLGPEGAGTPRIGR